MLPSFDRIMLPLLKFAADGENHTTHQAIPTLRMVFGLSEADIALTLKQSATLEIVNRIAWARVWLGKAGLIETVERKSFRITEKGRDLLARNPSAITLEDIKKWSKDDPSPSPREPTTPEAAIEDALLQLDHELRRSLKVELATLPPRGFELLVVKLLVRMGYGDGSTEAGSLTASGADGGIDGVIREDPLGLEKVYVQAKRWAGSVGAPVVSAFVGSLEAHHARHGVMITTSTFTAAAKTMLKSTGKSIVLVDGDELATLMIRYGVGVYEAKSFRICKVDLSPYLDD